MIKNMETNFLHGRFMAILCFSLALSLISVCRGAVSNITTKDFFNGILSGAASKCVGKNFYKYSDFISAAESFTAFGSTGTLDDQKREIAAFFANVAHETGSLCYVEQIDKSDAACDITKTQYPCAPKKLYYGRGPLQLTWNYNYGAAGKYLNVDLLNDPGLVARDDKISWKTALWFWNVNTNCHSAITSRQGFGVTIKAINGAVECNGKNQAQVADRVRLYTAYCNKLGVSRGNNPSC